MRIAICFVALVLMTTAVRAEDACETTPATLDTGETPAGRYYVVNDVCQPECLFSVWVYAESNGHDGLQRPRELCDDKGCGGEGCETDSILF